MTWEETLAKKKEVVNKSIIDGKDKLMNNITVRFVSAAFQAKGQMHYHIMIPICDDPEDFEKIVVPHYDTTHARLEALFPHTDCDNNILVKQYLMVL